MIKLTKAPKRKAHSFDIDVESKPRPFTFHIPFELFPAVKEWKTGTKYEVHIVGTQTAYNDHKEKEGIEGGIELSIEQIGGEPTARSKERFSRIKK